jgi:membrane fusion protein, multidrug efflux system
MKGSLGVAALAALLLVSHLLHRDPSAPTAPPVPVAVATVRSSDVPIELETIGHVAAFNVVTVRTLVGGQISAIAFADGQTVKEGDLLVQIDPRPLQATVNQDHALVERDRANLENAEADLKRYIPLVGAGIVSEQQEETQQALVAQLRSTLGADQAILDRDRLQLGYTAVRAPLSGLLGLRLVDVGNVVSSSDPAGLVVLTQVQPIAVLFALPQADLEIILSRRAAASGARLALEVWTQDGDRLLDEGSLSALSNQLDIASGTVTLKGVFANAKQNLWPGAAVSVRLVLDVQHDGLTIPAAAVEQGPQGDFAWVVDSGHVVRPAPLRLSQQMNGQALVASGLKPGEMVVTDGQYGLTPGAHVTIQTPQSENVASGSNVPPLRRSPPNRLGIEP